MDAKSYVLSRFPEAHAVQTGTQIAIKGIPGLVSTGITEEFAWLGAARDVADPITDSARREAAKWSLAASNKLSHSANELDRIWDEAKAGKFKKIAAEAATAIPSPAILPVIVCDDLVAQVLSVPAPDGHSRHVYARKPGGQWTELL